FLFSWSGSHCVLHSFPTRRSSDLDWQNPAVCLLCLVSLSLPAAMVGKTNEAAIAYVAPAVLLEHAEPSDVFLRRFLDEVIASDRDRKSTRLNSSHLVISYAVFCLK